MIRGVSKIALCITFICSTSIAQSQVVDANGKWYQTVMMDDQEWMATNLDVNAFRNGDPIPEAKTPEEWEKAGMEKKPCWRYHTQKGEDLYVGKLYNYYAVTDARGLAPEGWRIPEKRDAQVLVENMGGQDVAGTQLKAKGDLRPKVKKKTPKTTAFNALMTGKCPGNGKPNSYGSAASWWTTTPSGLKYAFSLGVAKTPTWALITTQKNEYGLAVRCLKGENPRELSYKEFEQKELAEKEAKRLKKEEEQKAKDEKYRLAKEERLRKEEEGRARLAAALKNRNKVHEGAITIQAAKYGWTKIGEQTWLSQDLNITKFNNGDEIPQAKTLEEWVKAGKEKKPAWCYYKNDAKNGQKYGRLYNWFVASDPRGIAPKGWRVPTYNDFKVLKTFFGDSKLTGNMLRSSEDWVITDGVAKGSNDFNFNALPCGARNSKGEFVENEGIIVQWWTADEAEIDFSAWLFKITARSGIAQAEYFPANGMSIRLVKE
jgi:uncharacterized protein (TIGR02145 family)